jgi:hypothetical protein
VAVHLISDDLSDKPLDNAKIEAILLWIAGAFIGVNFIALTIVRSENPFSAIVSFGVWILCAVGGRRLLQQHLPMRDYFLFPIVMFLSGWGLVIIDRLAPQFADRQTIWLLLGVGAMMIVALTPHILYWLRIYRY